jgi:hypothetical protein
MSPMEIAFVSHEVKFVTEQATFTVTPYNKNDMCNWLNGKYLYLRKRYGWDIYTRKN